MASCRTAGSAARRTTWTGRERVAFRTVGGIERRTVRRVPGGRGDPGHGGTRGDYEQAHETRKRVHDPSSNRVMGPRGEAASGTSPSAANEHDLR